MRSSTRPLAAAASATLLVLARAAGGGGDEQASDDKSPSDPTSAATSDATSDATTGGVVEAKDLCGAIANIVAVTGSIQGTTPTEEEWGKLQDVYGDLTEVELPADIPANEKAGLEVASEAITSLSYDEAKKAFGDADGSSDIPGVSKEENAQAEAFFQWAVKECPDAVGGGQAASSATVPESSVTAE